MIGHGVDTLYSRYNPSARLSDSVCLLHSWHSIVTDQDEINFYYMSPYKYLRSSKTGWWLKFTRRTCWSVLQLYLGNCVWWLLHKCISESRLLHARIRVGCCRLCLRFHYNWKRMGSSTSCELNGGRFCLLQDQTPFWHFPVVSSPSQIKHMIAISSLSVSFCPSTVTLLQQCCCRK